MKKFNFLFLIILILFANILLSQTNAVLNSDFESSNQSPWVTSPYGVVFTNSANAYSGSKYGTMPVSGTAAINNASGFISQTFSIPTNATNIVFSYYSKISTTETTPSIFDVMTVTMTDQFNTVCSTNSLSNLDNSTSYIYRSYNTTACSLAGKTITLKFQATNDASLPTTFRVDNVSLNYNVTGCVIPNPTNLTVDICSPNVGNCSNLRLTVDPVPGASGYRFEYFSPWLEANTWYTIGTTSSNYIDFNTTNYPNTPFYFRVWANCGGNYYHVTATTVNYSACAMPRAPSFINVTNTTAKCRLNDLGNGNNSQITTYSLYCNNTDQFIQSNGTLGSNEYFDVVNFWESITINGLQPSSDYSFSVFARNKFGTYFTGPSDVGWIFTKPDCVQWTNGSPTKQIAIDATKWMCEHSVLDPIIQNYGALNSISLAKAAKYTLRTLYNGYPPTKIFNDTLKYPTGITDIEAIVDEEEQYATTALTFLEYSDGIPAITRNFGSIIPNAAITHGEILKMVLESYDIKPDNSESDIYIHEPTIFLPNIYRDNPECGYFKKALSIGIISDYVVNGNFDFQNKGEFLFVVLYKLMQQYGIKFPSLDQFPAPNNQSKRNIYSDKGIERAIFETYEQSGFNLPSGGLGLNFDISYHSDFLDYPFANEDRTRLITNSANNYISYSSLENHFAITHNFPLGLGWTHSYNIYANILAGKDDAEKYILFNWGDGSKYYYNLKDKKFESLGVYDVIVDSLRGSNQRLSEFKIKTKNQIYYKFVRNNNQFYLESIKDRNGNFTNLTYENAYCFSQPANCYGASSTRLKQVTDTFGNRTLNLTYATDSDLLRSVSDGTRTINFGSSKYNLDLDSFTDAKGQITSYTYGMAGDSLHLLKTITKPKGNVISNNYFKRKLKQTKNNVYKIDINFTTNYSSNIPNTLTNIKTTQSNNQIIQTAFCHNIEGNVDKINSNTTNIKFTYGDINNPTLPTETFDANTQIQEINVYDARGNVTSTTKLATSMTPIVNTFVYNSFNDLTRHTDPKNGITNLAYDSKGNLISKSNPLLDVTTFNILNGLVEYSLNPEGIKTIFGYNSFGNLTSIQNNLSPTSFIKSQASYDNLSRIIAITNPKNVQTTFQHDLNDNLTKEIQDPTGLNYATEYTYDKNDNLTSIKNARNNITSLTYDPSTDDLIQETFGAYSKYWTYNTDGTTKSFTNKKGDVFNFQYYPAGDSREGLLKNDGYAEYNYNTTTKSLSTNTRNTKVLTYSYDSFQRITGINYNDFTNNNVGYQYDFNNNVTRITYPDGKYFTYEWDLNNRLVKITDWQGRILVQYSYFLDGRLLNEIHGNSTSTNYRYDAVGRLDSLLNKKANGGLIGYRKITLDAVGNILSEKKYDTDNNFIPNLTTATNNYVNDATNRQTSINSVPVSYDGNGNQTSYSGTAFTWDIQDNLLTATQPTGNLTFEYDPLENRRLKNNTRYVLDILNGSNVLAETDLNGSPTSIFVHGLGLVCRLDIATNTYSYYHYDMRGSTTTITDATGNVITHKYIYDDNGSIFQNTELFPQPFKYVGKYGVMYDAPNLTFMRARYYNPKTGRFLSEDPIWSTNLFTYAGNNAIINIDPKGEYIETALDVASLALNINAYKENKSFLNGVAIAADVLTMALPGLAGGGTAVKLFVKYGGKTFENYKAAKGGTKTLAFIGTNSGVQRISTEFHHLFISQKMQKSYTLPNWVVNNNLNVMKLNTIQHSILDSRRFNFLRKSIKNEVGILKKYNLFTKF